MKVAVLDIKGNKVKDITLKDEVFGVVPNKEVLAQYLRVYKANQRQGTSSTKTRAEVSGGGRKPWRQKGTGRARHGSTRSPIWRHGGVAHGPKPKNWSLSLPKKIRRLAIKSSLSQKFLDKEVVLIDKFEFETHKTKDTAKIFEKLGVGKKTLIVWKDTNENLFMGSANLPYIKLASAENLNVYEVLDANKVLFSEAAIRHLEEKYKNETK